MTPTARREPISATFPTALHLMTATAAKTYRYKGWTFHQVARGNWAMRRLSDGFSTWHHSRGGCEAFIRRVGLAADPDAALLEFARNLTHA
jgi:hypothetical protein